MKLLFTIVAILTSLPSFLFASIDLTDPTIEDQLNRIQEDYSVPCDDYSVTLHLPSNDYNHNHISNDFISSPIIRCLNIENNDINFIAEEAFAQLPDLQYLNLRRNSIAQNNLFSFGNLSSVRKLILSDQRNSYIGETIVRGVHRDLQYLDLSNIATNTLQSQQDDPFPNLTHLDLSQNKIVNFDPINTILPEQLAYLNLDQNLISQISLNRLYNLSILQLDNNEIKTIDRHSGLGLKDLINLKKLSVTNNQISSISTDAFKDTVNLRYLNISMNALSAINSEVFDCLSSLLILALDDNMLTEIPLAVSDQQLSITTLSMNCNRIRFLSSNALFNLPDLKTLSLSGNMIWYINMDTFQKQTKLEELYLNDNQLTNLPEGWCATMKNLRYLNLEGNKFSSLESMHLTTVPSLRQVYFGFNSLDYISANSIKALPENVTIYLGIDKNHCNQSLSTCKRNNNLQLE